MQSLKDLLNKPLNEIKIDGVNTLSDLIDFVTKPAVEAAVAATTEQYKKQISELERKISDLTAK